MTQTIVNLGTGGAVLNGRNGSTSGADSNDALFLDWTGLDYVYLPGVAGNFLSVPDAAALDITGDIDIRVHVALDDWTPAAISRLAGKYGVSGQRSYLFDINTAGLLRLTWSADGTALTTTSATVATGIADGTVKWVRVTLDVDNGASGNDIKFFLSDDGVTWTQLGSTITTAGVASLFNSTTLVSIGSDGAGTAPAAAKIYRAQVFNGIDGTKVLDVDTSVITSGAATSFTALTGQTVTINRSTAGRKTVAVVSPVWLFGTDDFMEVADNDLIDFGATDSFTVLAVVRQWATPTASGYYVSKRSGSPQTGYSINSSGNPLFWSSTLLDGINTKELYPAYPTAGTLLTAAATINEITQVFTSYTNGSLASSTSTSGLGSLVNAGVLRIGSFASGGSNQDFELLAVAVFRRALTATEISRISAYYQSRLS